MSFQNIIGQERAINYLLKSIIQNKIASSYIFNGKEGVGKKTTAIEFAKCINCLNIMENYQSCENCPSCKKINKNICPDVKIIEPEKDRLKIEQIREFRKDIYMKPFENKKKIYIINNAEELTTDAANCLLKTIEEPPEFAVIILICSNINSILPTIISRCRVLYFRTISSLGIEKTILERNGSMKNKAKIIAKIARGSIGKALDISADADFLNRRNKILNQLAEIIPGKIDCEMLNRKEKIFSDANDSKVIMEIILLWYRDLLLIKELNCRQYIVNDDRLALLTDTAKLYSKKMLIDILNYLLQVQEYLKKNANKNILFESLIIKLSGVVY